MNYLNVCSNIRTRLVFFLFSGLIASGCTLNGEILGRTEESSVRVLTILDASWFNLGTSSAKIRWTDSKFSLVSQYELAVGTTAGATDIMSWTSVGNVLYAQLTGLNLVDQQRYFVSIRSNLDLNEVVTSDGWYYRLNGANAFENFVSMGVTAFPRDVITFDFNNDGYLDIVSADGGAGSDVSVILSDGVGGYAPAYQLNPQASNPQGLRIADVVGDSNPDLIVGLYWAWGINIFPGNGDGTFDANIYLNLSSITSVDVGDINNDGHLDIIATSDLATDKVYVLLNNNRSFDVAQKIEYSVSDNPKTGILGDWNQDGKLDIAVVSESANKLGIMAGVGDGTFGAVTELVTGAFPRGVASVDFDQDGDLDLVVSAYNADTVTQFTNNGAGVFTAGLSLACVGKPHGITVSDINGDGLKDLVVASNVNVGVGLNTVGVFLGNGTTGFSSRMEYATGPTPMRTTVADLNKDGLMDILVANGGAGANQSTISVLYGK